MPRLQNTSAVRALFIVVALVFANAARAADEYTAKSGRVAFTVGTNIPFLKVSGSSTALSGGGAASVNDDTATVTQLHFEIDPASFTTGLAARDQHLRDRVFRASDGSLPRITLQADRFVAKVAPPATSWTGELRAELSMRGVTRPITFRVSAQRKGDGAIVRAEGRLRTSDFEVGKIANGLTTVKDEVTIRVTDLVLTR